MKRIGLLAVTLTMLAACGSPMEHHLAKTAEQGCNWLRWFADLPVCNTYVAPKKLAPEPAIHCYRTIGAVECHTQEIDGWAEVGSS
jgi:hypothetical protein